MILFKNKCSMGGSQEVVTHDGLGVAMFESFCEFDKIQGGIPIALSNVYEMCVTDTSKSDSEKSVVLEGVLSDAWEKIKAFFKKVADKIREWFKAALKFFQTIFMSNSKFIAKFRDELTTKDSSKFTYSGHKWKDITSGFAELKGKSDKGQAKVKTVFDMANDEVKDNKPFTAEARTKLADMKKEIDAVFNSRSVADARTKLRKEITGGEKRDIRNFSAVSVSAMIDAVDNEKETKDLLQEGCDEITDATEKINDELDKLKSTAESTYKDSTERSNFVSWATNCASAGKYTLSYMTGILEELKSLLHEQVSEYSSALRSFARYKPAKESYMGVDSNSQSLLEAYMIDA